MTDTISPRLKAIIDDRVFSFAQAAQRHFKTNDLVVLLDFRSDTPELEAVPRQSLADAGELSADVRLKFSKPASALSEILGAPEQSFWFLVIYEDEDADCAAIKASMLAAGGLA